MAHTAGMNRPALSLILTFLVTLPAASAALADQNDESLDGLFELLASTEHPAVLTEIENRIWAAWYQHPDPAIEQLLETGMQYMNTGLYADALVIFNTVIEQDRNWAEAWNRRATLHYLMGNFQQSISDIEQTLALEPRHFGALSGLGLVYLQLNNLDMARQAFESLLEVHPHSPAGQENLELVRDALRGRFI